MKKFFALILICTLCLVLCACGQQAQAPETDGGRLYHAEILSDRDDITKIDPIGTKLGMIKTDTDFM